MKTLLTSLIALLILPLSAKAFDYQKALYNYVIPCAVSVAVGTLMDSENGQTVGVTVCAGVSAYAGMQELSNSRAATMRDVATMGNLLKQHNQKVATEITKDLGGRIDQISKDRQAFLLELRAQVATSVADQSTFMSEQMAERLKSAMSSPDFIPDLMNKINARVKAEVASEYDLRRNSIIRETVEDVIRQVTARPVEAPRTYREAIPKKEKNTKQYEDEE